jgi:hypothetical protein
VSAPSRRTALVAIALFAGAALISGFTLLRAIDPFDEGLALQAARRVAGGEVPYSDFLWAYGPGAPYLLAALQELFGVSLVPWRAARVLVDAAVAVTVFALVRRETGSAPLALAGWLLAACSLADPRSANPVAYALLLGLAGFAVACGGARPSVRRAAAAGALAGLAAAFRIDFGLFAAAAVVATVALRPGAVRLRDGAGAAAAAVGVGLLAYLPFLIAVGPGDLYDALIGTSLRESEYWTLPFPLAYEGGLGGPREWKDVLDFYVPLLLVAGAVAAAVAVALRWRSERRVPYAALGLLVLAAGFALYLSSRSDPFHTQPLAVALAALLPIAVVSAQRIRPLAAAAAVLLALLLVQAVGDRLTALFRPPELSAVALPAADGVKAPPDEARALERAVGLVRELVPPGEPIYVLPRRSDLVTLSAPVLYVLAERDNPTRQDHGLLTTAPAQRRIIATLERERPRAIVRWTDPLSSEPEPNLRGRSSRVGLLDAWVRENYTQFLRAGYYDVLVPGL